MNTLFKTFTPALITLVASAALSGTALAGESVHGFAHESVGTPKTRAEVMADFVQSRQADLQNHASTRGDHVREPVLAASSLTRAQVLADLRDAQASGEFALLHANEPELVRVHAPAVVRTSQGTAPIVR